MRRDAYASHVKAKHMKEIATLLLEEFKEYEINTISSYAKEHSTKAMPICSKMYQDAEYWFGVKPLFYIRESIEIPHDANRPDTNLKSYPEDEELRQYLKREENLNAHRKFIEEVLQSIPMMDFISIGKNIKIRNPDVLCMKQENSTLKKNLSALEESSKNEIERLKAEVELWKETAQEKECIAYLRKDLQSARSHAQSCEKTATLIKEQMEQLKKEQHEQITSLNQRNLKTESQLYDQYDGEKASRMKLEQELIKEKNDRTVKTSSAVQKAEEKQREALQKAFDKEREAWKKKEKALKKKVKLAKKDDSDSDSDSD